jgi:ribonuclease J
MTGYKPLRIIPLGGLGEIGKNMMIYEYGDECFIVDTGLMFPENDMLGIDYIIPDMQYLMNKLQTVKGIVITHGHEDHIGAIQHVLEKIQAPIYATPLTRGLIEAKLGRNGGAAKANLNTVKAGETVGIGPFRVEFFHVCHSIPDSVGLGIHSPCGLIVHTGDYKFDQTPVDNWPTDFAKLAEFSQQGVLALLADSTNSERAGWTPSEKVIDPAFDHIFREAKGRIIIASFASLVSRMQQVATAASRYKRKMAFVGTSMVDNAKIARKLGYLNIEDNLLVPLDQALNLRDREVVIMCTGSQGEPTSVLGRLSAGKFRLFEVKQGDTIILSSHPIPGNEEIVYHTINRLLQSSANVFYETISPVHVSGHASQEEMKLLINLVHPQFLIPIHGEMRHLQQHAKIGMLLGIAEENIAVVENGQVIEFAHEQMRLAERVPGSYVFVEGSSVGDIGPDVMRQREILSQGGIITVHMVLNASDGRLRQEPKITSYGFTSHDEESEILTEVQRVAAQAVDHLGDDPRKDIEKAIRNQIYAQTGRRPVIDVTISSI